MIVTQYTGSVLLLLLMFIIPNIIVQLPALTNAFGFHHRESKKTKCLNPPRTARRVESVIAQCQEEVKTKLVGEALLALKEDFNRAQEAALHTVVDSAVFLEDHTVPLPIAHTTNAWNGHDDGDDDHFLADEQPPQTTPGRNIPAQLSTIEWQPFLTTVTPLLSDSVRKNAIARHRIQRRSIESGSMFTTDIYHPTLVPMEDKRIAGCLLHCVYAKNNAIDQLGWPTLDGLVDFYSEGVNEHGFFMATLRSVNLCLHAVTKKYHVDRRHLPAKGESCDLAFDVFDCISDQITGYCLDHYKH